MCLQLFSLDRDLGDFFRLLDSKGIDYMVVLTADHGGQDIPERRRGQGVPGAARVDAKLTAREVGAAVGAKLGLQGPGPLRRGHRSATCMSTAPCRRRDAGSGQIGRRRRFRAHPQVEAVFTRRAAGRSSVADLAARRMDA